MNPDLRLGRWEDVLADVQAVDAVVCDPPFSERTHRGHNSAALSTDETRSALPYEPWTADDVERFVASWAPRCRGWMVACTDSTLSSTWRTAYERQGLISFAPVIIFVPGSTVRLSGDGPTSWATFVMVARPPALHRWGALPGGYSGPPERTGHPGSKPLWASRALIRSYSRPGDLVCDPTAGSGSTLLAAVTEGRRAIGAEMDPETYAKAQARLARGFTPDLFAGLG